VRFRKRPVVVEAVQFTGSNASECFAFCPVACEAFVRGSGLVIPTLEGDMAVRPGDWIIRGVKGEFYPCKPDIFAVTYEPISSLDAVAEPA
jgi:hypothetical protein